MGNLMNSQSDRLGLDELQGKFGFKSPCYLDSALLGFTSGGFAAMHAYRKADRARVITGLDWGIKATCLVAIGSYVFCSYKYHTEHDKMIKALQQWNDKKRGRTHGQSMPESPTEESG